MAEQVNLNLQILDSLGSDVTGEVPYYQEIPVNKMVLTRIQDFPVEGGTTIPNYLLVLNLGNTKPLERTRREPELRGGAVAKAKRLNEAATPTHKATPKKGPKK